MTWGTFGVIHITTLVLAAGMIVGLYFLLKNKSDKVKTIVLGILSFAGIAAIIFNLVTWGSPIEYLPLHLCSLNAMVLPIAVLTRNKVLNNLLLLWCIGAFFALAVNFAQTDYEIFSWTFFFYYFPHVLELGIPILMFVLKLTQKDVKCILSTLAITIVSYTAIHFVNVGINAYTVANNITDYAGEIIQVNYMYSIHPENPVLDLFYAIIPASYWYMYLSFIVVTIYLGIVYLKDIILFFKEKTRKTQE